VTLANGVITYTPPTNYTGSDSFTYQITDGIDTVTGTVAISVQAADPNRNRLGLPTVLLGGAIQIKFAGVLGLNYEIHRCTDLNAGDWTPLTTMTPLRNGTLTFTDTNPPPVGFYRTVAKP